MTLNRYGDNCNVNALEIYGLSHETKPIRVFKGMGIANGSCFVEIDTGKIYLYSEDNLKWYLFGGSCSQDDTGEIEAAAESGLIDPLVDENGAFFTDEGGTLYGL